MKQVELKNLVKVSIFGALAFVVMLIEFPLGIFPDFLKLDFSDCVALIISFALGPAWGVGVEFLKNVLHLFVTKTAGIGEFANFMIGGFFVYIAGYIYAKNRTKKGAAIALIISTIAFSIWAGLLNYFVLLPLYEKALKFPISEIVKIASKVNGFVTDKFTLILFSIIPFNLVKGAIISVVTFILYKRLSKIVKR
ncbi:ECF transporter S component [Anaerocellum diazotrophicum]|uniref:Riboflavin transporter n=1 Tax=Caldicellulosiruptor diazotrophicus TaxID=2806205 RepID=A0ABM7NMH3_9FIRM|nr:ECF transporter S component [Caldicellulosiruptor diazotrophicus]BCS81326.1 riboflavin transporter [Caldicellulosiruptor diazotrophicus]